MQNIGKTDINSPGSKSQQDHRQERSQKKVARNRRQVRLSAETKDGRRNSKLKETSAWTTTTDIRAKKTSSCLEEKGTNREIGLSQNIGFNIRLILN